MAIRKAMYRALTSEIGILALAGVLLALVCFASAVLLLLND